MPLLGWRYREPYATKSTFITLVIEDGAKPDVIRDRVTHTKAARDAFRGCDRGPHWIAACGEVRKLRLTRRLATSFATAGELLELTNEKVEAAEVEGSNMDARIREDHIVPSTSEVAIDTVADPRDQALSHDVLQAVLDGDYERARRLAEEWRRLAADAPVLRTVK